MQTQDMFSLRVVFERLMQQGWTRKQIAEHLGVDEPFISRVMRGYQVDVRLPKLIRMAQGLHITIDDLIRLGDKDEDVSHLGLRLIDEMYESGFQTQHEEGRFVAAVA